MIVVPIQNITDRRIFRFFDCGNEDLNIYFQKYAAPNDVVNISKSFVCFDDDKKSIIGFYTLCAANIINANLPDDLKRSLPKYPCPCVRIARLGVDKKYQKQNYGKALLKDAFLRIINASSSIGVYGVLVDSKEESRTFYEHFGFIKLNSTGLEYFLPLSTIIEAFKTANSGVAL